MQQQGFSRANLGILLAVLAGILAISLNWGVGGNEQYGRYGNILWVAFTILVGIAYIAAAVIVDRSTRLAKGILLVGALLQVASAVYFGVVLGGGYTTAIIDLMPAALAFVAALLIGPRRLRAAP